MDDLQKQNQLATNENFSVIAKNYLKSMGNKLDDNQANQFINICQAYGLNPFKREIYGISYNTKDGPVFNIIVGYEVYLKRAERSGKLDGWKCEIVGNGAEMKAVVEIYRKDWKFPFVHEVYLPEATTGKSLWQSKPRFMLKKVAIGQAFRLCFPDDLGGLPYLEEEIQKEEINITPRQEETVVNEKPTILGEEINQNIFDKE